MTEPAAGTMLAGATEAVPATSSEHTGLGGVEDGIGLFLRERAVGDRVVEALLQHGAALVASRLQQPLPDGGQRVVTRSTGRSSSSASASANAARASANHSPRGSSSVDDSAGGSLSGRLLREGRHGDRHRDQSDQAEEQQPPAGSSEQVHHRVLSSSAHVRTGRQAS
jgi:hypothetical protein